MFNLCSIIVQSLFKPGSQNKCICCCAHAWVCLRTILDYYRLLRTILDCFGLSWALWSTKYIKKCDKYGTRNKLIKLQHICYGNGPETGTHGLDNLDRYAAGRAPRGYSKWPFNHFKLSDIEIHRNVQNQVNKVPLPILPGKPKYESSCDSNTDDSDMNEDLSSSGSSSSD